MIKQKQLFRHKPAEGIYGDCHRTVIACLLNKMPEEVPNFGIHVGNATAFHKAVDEYLATQDLAIVEIPYNDTLENILNAQVATNKNSYFLLAGESKTGVNHSVIGYGGAIEWDPSLDDSGIVGPCDDGYYWISHLVPLFMKEVRE